MLNASLRSTRVLLALVPSPSLVHYTAVATHTHVHTYNLVPGV